MIRNPDHVRRFSSAKLRFVKGALNNFFQREFPKLLGPILRERLVEELIKIIDKTLPAREHFLILRQGYSQVLAFFILPRRGSLTYYQESFKSVIPDGWGGTPGRAPGDND